MDLGGALRDLDRRVEPDRQPLEQPEHHRREPFSRRVVLEQHVRAIDRYEPEARGLQLRHRQRDARMQGVEVLEELAQRLARRVEHRPV